jgi:hypothetical protein
MTEVEALVSIANSLKYLANMSWWIAFWLFGITLALYSK